MPSSPRPSLGLLRSLSDEHVVRALMAHRQLTRAELAAVTGISKPTISQSVRRLAEAGTVTETGERSAGRGRSGAYVSLRPDVGVALVVSIAPGGVVAETVDVYGSVLSHQVRPVGRRPGSARVAEALADAAAAALSRGSGPGPGPVHVAAVSAADPVERSSGRLIHLPDAPFLVGDLDPVEILEDLVHGPVLVDNDVNWAAQAERDHAVDTGVGLDNFAYLHLGEGLGCAVVADGMVVRGAHGFGGEIAHLLTRGPDGQAAAFIEVFASVGLRQADSTAVDVEVLRRLLEAPAVSPLPTSGHPALTAVLDAVAGVLLAVVALTDPALVVIGGEWGSAPATLAALEQRLHAAPRQVTLAPAAVTDAPALAGARRRACDQLRQAILAIGQSGGEPDWRTREK